MHKPNIHKYIYITKKRKLNNPCFTGDEFKYNGPMQDFNFKISKHNYKIQYNNFIKIQKSLKPYNLSLTYIWAGISSTTKRFQFIAKTTNGEIYWRKYDIGGQSGQNSMYIGKNLKKINTSKWLKMKKHEQDQLLK